MAATMAELVIRRGLEEPDTSGQFVPHKPQRPEKSLGGKPFKLVFDYEPAGDQPTAIADLVAAIDGARDHVHMLFYIWLDDASGRAVAQAAIRAAGRGVKVRALMVDYGIDRAPNRSGVALLRLEARRRGLEDRFEARYVTFPMHTKAMTVDDRMVVAGSMNLHFSSWGPLGLNEAMLATTDAGAVAEQRASFEDVWARRSREAPQEWWMRNVPRTTPGRE